MRRRRPSLLPVPAAGDVTVANVTFTLKGGRGGALPVPARGGQVGRSAAR